MADFTKKKNFFKGSAKEREFSNGTSVINIDIKKEWLDSLPVSEGGYVKMTLTALKNIDKFGNTHLIYENDYKPDPSKMKMPQKAAPTPTTFKGGSKSTDDFPF